MTEEQLQAMYQDACEKWKELSRYSWSFPPRSDERAEWREKCLIQEGIVKGIHAVLEALWMEEEAGENEGARQKKTASAATDAGSNS